MDRLPDKQVVAELKRWEINFQTTSDETLIVERAEKVPLSFFSTSLKQYGGWNCSSQVRPEDICRAETQESESLFTHKRQQISLLEISFI